MDLNWTSILSVTVALVTFLTGAMTGVLSLFIDNKLNRHKNEIIQHIDQKFALKETIDLRFKNMENEVARLDKK